MFETDFRCNTLFLTPNQTPCLALPHPLSYNRTLCSSHRRHFESQPILPGELEGFHLYHFSAKTEGLFPAETLIAFGTSTDRGLRVRGIQAVHVLDQPTPPGAQLVREKQRSQIRPAAAQQYRAPSRRSGDEAGNDNHLRFGERRPNTLGTHSGESRIERRSLGDQSNLLWTQKLRANPRSRERKSQ